MTSLPNERYQRSQQIFKQQTKILLSHHKGLYIYYLAMVSHNTIRI